MNWFLPVFLACFLCVSAYVWARMASAFGLACRGAILLAQPFLLLPAGFVLVHMYGGRWPESLACAVEHAAGCWPALILWMLFFLLPLDLWNLLVRASGCFCKPMTRLRLPPATLAVIALCGTVVFFTIAVNGARRVTVNRVRIITERLGYDAPPLRIVLLSDLHIGRTSIPSTVRRVRDLVKEAKPDLLLCAGDFCDTAGGDAGRQAELFREIHPAFGKLAVLGNHEAYAGVEASIKILNGAGFRVLRDETVPIRDDWAVTGADDPAAGLLGELGERADAWLLPKNRGRRYVILLKHRPEVSEKARSSADLQLSGHTHGGQIFPFGWLVRRLYPFEEGRLLPFDGGLGLYISRGAGTWGPPLRLAAPPEITVITIEPKSFPDADKVAIEFGPGGRP